MDNGKIRSGSNVMNSIVQTVRYVRKTLIVDEHWDHVNDVHDLNALVLVKDNNSMHLVRVDEKLNTIHEYIMTS